MFLLYLLISYFYSFLTGSGGRRRILDNGNLVINPIGRDDEGIYICIAQNIYGVEESQGRLIVMRKYTY